jgi:hypothetical protein
VSSPNTLATPTSCVSRSLTDGRTDTPGPARWVAPISGCLERRHGAPRPLTSAAIGGLDRGDRVLLRQREGTVRGGGNADVGVGAATDRLVEPDAFDERDVLDQAEKRVFDLTSRSLASSSVSPSRESCGDVRYSSTRARRSAVHPLFRWSSVERAITLSYLTAAPARPLSPSEYHAAQCPDRRLDRAAEHPKSAVRSPAPLGSGTPSNQVVRCARPASRQIDSGAEDPAFDAVSRFAAAAQTARTSASRLTA